MLPKKINFYLVILFSVLSVFSVPTANALQKDVRDIFVKNFKLKKNGDYFHIEVRGSRECVIEFSYIRHMDEFGISLHQFGNTLPSIGVDLDYLSVRTERSSKFLSYDLRDTNGTVYTAAKIFLNARDMIIGFETMYGEGCNFRGKFPVRVE